MTCEVFRDSLDKMADSRQSINKDDLSSEMRSHLLSCASCTAHLESVSYVEDILINMQSDNIPSELYENLVGFGKEYRVKAGLVSSKLLVFYILKVLLPALSIWTIALFIPYTARTMVEIVLTIFAMVLVFEKIGRRLVTDRV
ncbi:MAG: hypothetical protein M1470_07915 [Bacteroidetes bacterium]|nr:hypothetical protein [Bacteroidota bacterium]MCL5738497.1 hypothetical protein [Bacteroidota bacterium]